MELDHILHEYLSVESKAISPRPSCDALTEIPVFCSVASERKAMYLKMSRNTLQSV